MFSPNDKFDGTYAEQMRINIDKPWVFEALEEQRRLQERLDGVLEDRAEAGAGAVGGASTDSIMITWYIYIYYSYIMYIHILYNIVIYIYIVIHIVYS